MNNINNQGEANTDNKSVTTSVPIKFYHGSEQPVVSDTTWTSTNTADIYGKS